MSGMEAVFRDFMAAQREAVIGVDLASGPDLQAFQVIDADGGYLVPPEHVDSVRYALATRRKASRGWRRHCRGLKASGRWVGKEVSRYEWGPL